LKVKLGIRQDAQVEVVEGIDIGDHIVVAGQQKLKDQQAVTTQPM